MAVIESILAGHREAEHSISLVSHRVKKSRQKIADALQGWWRDELLFELQALIWVKYDRKNLDLG